MPLMAAVLAGQTAPPPPPEYQDLYATMQSQIATFDQTVLQSWDRSKPPVLFGAELETANSNNGAGLLGSYMYKLILSELDGWKALGAKSAIVSIHYPILDPAFDAYGGNSAAYLTLYQQLAVDIRSRGMKMVADCGPLFSDPAFAGFDVQPFYDSLTTEQYNQGRADNCLKIAQQIGPDYLSVITEPDTEAEQTGKADVGTVAGSTALLSTIINQYRASGATVPVGAGVGTWQASYDQYIANFAAQPLDFIDMHVYPVNRDYLPRALKIADMAAAAGKRVAMTEAWSMKVRDSELGLYSASYLYGRDVFSFWAPIDQQFLQALVDFSYSKKLLFMSSSWSEYFRGYVEYNADTAGMSPSQLDRVANNAQWANFTVGAFTSTGQAWETMVLGSRDEAPPSPPILGVQSSTSGTVTIGWNRPADNVGATGYNIYRDGAPIAVTGYLSYTDSGLKDGTTYRYTAEAFDAQGNVSPLSPSLPVTTSDITPPSVPANLKATSVANTQVTLVWDASTDNVGVLTYRIYRGNTPATLYLVNASPVNGFTDSFSKSGQNLCYAVTAVDTRGLASAQTAPVCVWISDVTAPSKPTNLTATSVTATQVTLTWTQSTDNIGVTGYQVQRLLGTNPPVIVGTATGNTYTDVTATPGTTYTYKVLANDAAGNQSSPSIGVRVTTPKY